MVSSSWYALDVSVWSVWRPAHSNPQAAFIASIQALIVSFTKDTNKTPFETATNIVGACGIILDVTGAVLGATYVLVILNAIEDSFLLMKELNRIHEDHSKPNYSKRAMEIQLSDWENTRKECWDHEINRKKTGFTTWNFLKFFEILSFIVMGLGVACLIVSVVMFSASMGFQKIWIPCLSISSAASALAVMPLATIIGRQ